VEFPTAVAFERTQAGKQTRIAATIGRKTAWNLWTPAQEANEVAATIFVETIFCHLANGVLDVRTTLDYQISQANCARPRQPARRPAAVASRGRFHPHLES